MAEETWFVAIDGRQLDGARSTDEVRGLIRTNAGKKMVVWNEKMTGWAEPDTLPEFRAAAAPPAPAPAPAAPAAPASYAAPRAANAVASAVASSAPEARAMIQNEARFFKGLLDFKFQEFITPKIIRTLYIISMFFVALGFLAMIGTALMMIFRGMKYLGMGALMGVAYLVLAPIVALLQLTLSRVFFELVLVLFKIKESVVHIDQSKG